MMSFIVSRCVVNCVKQTQLFRFESAKRSVSLLRGEAFGAFSLSLGAIAVAFQTMNHTMTLGHPYVETTVLAKDIQYATPMSELYDMFESGEPVGNVFIGHNVCEIVLETIAAFLGIPFQFSSNMISGEPTNVCLDKFVILKNCLLDRFERSCSDNGKGFLPTPLNARNKMIISAVTYVWLGFLCIHGHESWRPCKSGCQILQAINDVTVGGGRE